MVVNAAVRGVQINRLNEKDAFRDGRRPFCAKSFELKDIFPNEVPGLFYGRNNCFAVDSGVKSAIGPIHLARFVDQKLSVFDYVVPSDFSSILQYGFCESFFFGQNLLYYSLSQPHNIPPFKMICKVIIDYLSVFCKNLFSKA